MLGKNVFANSRYKMGRQDSHSKMSISPCADFCVDAAIVQNLFLSIG